jgi:choice-of-anchor A domain-containing protein
MLMFNFKSKGMAMKFSMLPVVVAVLVMSGWHSSGGQISTILSEWNVITAGNLESVSDFNGNAYVGGNLTDSSSFTVAGNDHYSMPPGNVSLAVAGSISGGGPINVNAGNVVVGGSINGRTLNMNSHGSVTQGNPAALPASPVALVTSASKSWSALTANSTASAQNNDLTFNCAGNASLAVFNITASRLFAQNQSFDLNLGASTAQVIINVSGTSINEAGGENFNGNFSSWGNRVVFNFYDATSLSLSSSIYGYVVAPEATVSSRSTIVGGLMAETLDTSSEVELPSQAPHYADVVPDGGGTCALLGLSLSGLAALRRTVFRR